MVDGRGRRDISEGQKGTGSGMQRVLIIGASGGIGIEAVRLALAGGHRVRALARNAERIRIDDPALETRSADAADPEAVRSALEEVDAVIHVIGVAPSLRRMFTPIDVFSKTTAVLVSEMARAGVRRLVAVTGFGAGDSRKALSCPERIPHRLFLGTAYADKDRQEAIIRESDLDWLIVRPTILTNGPGRGRYKVLVSPETWRNGLIARRDVADFLVREATAPTHSRVAPVLAY
jgi:putative NADH-flavin reductase